MIYLHLKLLAEIYVLLHAGGLLVIISRISNVSDLYTCDLLRYDHVLTSGFSSIGFASPLETVSCILEII